MNIAKNVKTLCILGMTSLSLYAGASQADFGPYRGNPYLLPPPPAQFDAGFKQKVSALDARLDQQLQRILDGMEAGKVTLGEAIRLLQEHQAINALERQFLRDGRLGPNELADLDRRMDVASSHIFWEKHDYDRTAFKGRSDGGYGGYQGGPYNDRDGGRFSDRHDGDRR